MTNELSFYIYFWKISILKFPKIKSTISDRIFLISFVKVMVWIGFQTLAALLRNKKHKCKARTDGQANGRTRPNYCSHFRKLSRIVYKYHVERNLQKMEQDGVILASPIKLAFSTWNNFRLFCLCQHQRHITVIVLAL